MIQRRGLSEGLSFLLKALLIMIIPLNIYVESLEQLFFLPISGLLFTPIVGYPLWITGVTFFVSTLGTVLRNFVIGLIIAFPGIYFTYKLSRVPVNRSYWKRGIGAATGIFFFAVGIQVMLTMNSYNPTGFWDESLSILLQNLNLYPTLVIGVFIILPLVLRQAVIIGSPSHLHYHSMNEIESNSKLSVSREKTLSGFLWFILCFAPFTIAYNPFTYWNRISYTGILMNYYFGTFFPYDIRVDPSFLQLSAQVTNFGFLPFIALMAVFHFAFVRDIYRYLRKTITRQRLIAMAIFSCIAPYFISMGFISSIFYNMASLLPIPILQGVGFLIIRYHRPHADQVDRVWDEDTHRVWWEKQEARPVPVTTTHEKPQRHRDGEVITIPVHYLFLSRLRRINRRNR